MRFRLSPASHARARITLRTWLAGYRGYKRVYHPFVDLGVRLSIAQAYFRSGIVKATDWQTALYLARHEYPVSWMSADHAALIGIGIELICPIFLALGLFTRAAALPMAILAIVVQANYQALDTNLFWAALLLRYVVFGARELSIDAILAPGECESALPLADRTARMTRAFTGFVGPFFQLGLRLWVAWALLRLPASPAFFPVTTFHDLLPPAISIAGAAMLALGIGTSIANKLLVAASLGMHMMMTGEPDGLWMVLLLAQFGVIGAGPWSLDAPIHAALVKWMKPNHGIGDSDDWPRVVIVGAGFGGLACAAKLRHLPVHLTIVDRHNHHLFQPLLYQVATAGLSPADIASPIREQFRDDPNVRVIMATVTGVDAAARIVHAGDRTFDYDMLVLATGATHGYFGREDWAAAAPGLKRLDDATAMRSRLLTAFEHAENTEDSAERDRLLTFVIVGGGPTGVELAGAIAELARFGFVEDFTAIDPARARIILVQSGPRILATFPETLSVHARQSLERLGVEVRVDSRVEEIDAGGVTIAGERLPAGTIFWAAGVVASPAAEWLGMEPDEAGRAPVNAFLQPANHSEIFVIGDTAASVGWLGKPVPGLAPAAKQAGQYVARVIRARLEMRDEPSPFAYRHRGSLATIGRKAAVADFGRVKLWGTPAWWVWGAIHVLFLTGARNRVAVVTAWIWSYLTYRSGSRLITGTSAVPRPDRSPST